MRARLFSLACECPVGYLFFLFLNDCPLLSKVFFVDLGLWVLVTLIGTAPLDAVWFDVTATGASAPPPVDLSRGLLA